MRTIRFLDSSGDRVLAFDETARDAAAREARALFERALASGGAAFKVNRGEGRTDERVHEFNALESETVIIPRITGG